MKKRVLVWLAIFCIGFQSVSLDGSAQAGSATVVINEVMADNSKTALDGFGDASDWIELYNTSAQAVDLSGCFLSDDASNLTVWQFPVGSVIAPNGFLFIWAADKNDYREGEYYCSFKISKEQETVFLTDRDGSTILDQLEINPAGSDCSVGRVFDGADAVAVFSVPTPRMSNRSGTVQVQKPVFSMPAGLYTEGFDLMISTSEDGADIYYTLDGSMPTTQSILYQAPIRIESKAGTPNGISEIPTNNITKNRGWQRPDGEVFKGTVVRAISVKNGIQSLDTTCTYLVDPEIHTRYGVPIVSISTDPANLFDDKIGIYVEGENGIVGPPRDAGTHKGSNYNQTGNEWERPANFEYIDKTGKGVISQSVGLRIHGAFSRQFPQKSLRVYARDEDGGGDFEFAFFEDSDVEKFDNIILRNAGNNFGRSMFIDAAYQHLWKWTTLPIQDFSPAVVFINGEYWGIHNIRERYSKHYFKDHFGGEQDNFTILDGSNYELDEGTEQEREDFLSVLSFVKNNDMSLAKNYDYIKTKVDVDNVADYFVAEFYAANNDWPGNNIGVFKYNTDYHPNAAYGLDGRWRYYIRDVDQASAYDSPETDNMTKSLGSVPLLDGLLKNQEFKTLFINRFMDHMNTTFSQERVLEFYDGLVEIYRELIDEHIKRWRTPASFEAWYQDATSYRAFANQRPQYMRQILCSNFGLSGETASLNVKTDASMGMVQVNSIPVKDGTPGVDDPSNWYGTYFSDVPVTLTALPKPGYRFAGWSGAVSSQAETVTLQLGAQQQNTVTATFVPVSDDAAGLLLNELVASNQGIESNWYFDDDNKREDYIELMNNGVYTINVGGFCIGTGDGTVWTLPERVLRPGETLVVWASGNDISKPQKQLHSNFKLASGGETVTLFSRDGITVLDSVAYTDLPADMAYARTAAGWEVQRPTIFSKNTGQ